MSLIGPVKMINEESMIETSEQEGKNSDDCLANGGTRIAVATARDIQLVRLGIALVAFNENDQVQRMWGMPEGTGSSAEQENAEAHLVLNKSQATPSDVLAVLSKFQIPMKRKVVPKNNSSKDAKDEKLSNEIKMAQPHE
ncbi:hypothetical protein ACH5RR_000707 [Cinchona calisaya]|uniref:Uncharacterized protein n=1 Tax=Cinchona calisaya TaxID=153742 RepID=A0ABD3B1N6_9GENT